MIGKLYCVGVGPGDPELLTLKAVRILNEVSCIVAPKGREKGKSVALSVVKKVLNPDNKEIIEAYFPMRKTKRVRETESQIPNPELKTLNPNLEYLDTKWNETVKHITNRINKGVDVAFITIGDPTIYSTFFHLYDRLIELVPALNIEIIPGVSSINAAASRVKIVLGLADERIAILPANTITLKDLEKTLDLFDTVVLMKVDNVFASLLKILDTKNLLDKAIYVSKVGMDDERIFKNIKDVKEGDLNYFSIMIIKNPRP